MSGREMKEYLGRHRVGQLLENLLTGLLFHRPDDPISFLQSCLTCTRLRGGPGTLTWDTFIHQGENQREPTPSQTKPQTGTLLTPISPPTLPPEQSPLPSPVHFGLQLPPVRFKSSVPSPLMPPVEPKVLSPAPPTPPGSTLTAEVTTEHTKILSKDAQPPALGSQLSIDSDSDMTESSGLQQELSLLPRLRPRPLIIFILGGPGSGKGRQTARLTHLFGLQSVSLDELLRRQLLSNASACRKWEIISHMMSHRELGPQEDVVPELRQQLIGQPWVVGFVVDGFPRDVHQALSFQEQVGSPDLVVMLLCSNETLRCRLQRRATGLGLLGDSSQALQRHLDRFQRDIISISRYYKQLHLLTQVDGNRDEDAVFADLSSVIRQKLFLRDQSDAASIPECNSADFASIKFPSLDL